MPKPRPTRTDKLHDANGYPKVVPINENMSKRCGNGTVVIPTPIDVYELMREVPQGKVTTINEIRSELARKHGATIGCPITTGIFCFICFPRCRRTTPKRNRIRHALLENTQTGGLLNEKYSGGAEAQKLILENEGPGIVKKGKNYTVQKYEEVLAKL
jgi:hypothetical protein